LRADKVLGGDADRPAEPCRLRDHLVEGVDVLGAANARNRLHVGAAFEQLHAERDRTQLQEVFQVGGDVAKRL